MVYCAASTISSPFQNPKTFLHSSNSVSYKTLIPEILAPLSEIPKQSRILCNSVSYKTLLPTEDR